MTLGEQMNWYDRFVKARSQVLVTPEIDSLAAVDRFRKAAEAFTARATKSPAAARRVLVDEGIYTKSGKLTKRYS